LRIGYGLIILFFSVFLAQGVRAAETPGGALPLDAEKAVVEDEGSRQLRIYTDTLLTGASEAIRLDAAMGLLIRKDTAAQEVLLKALSAKDNPMSQTAVCKGLIKGRTLGAAVGSLEIFLLPLVDMLKSPDASGAHLAAEALLVFQFDQISKTLSDLAQSSATEKQMRLNIIYALQLRPEPEALKYLIQLLNDSDTDVVRGAEQALQESFGVPMGTGREVWAKILKDLEKKDPEEIRRERLLRQETRLREIQADRDRWQKLYIGVVDKEFEGLDAASKTAYLQERLGSDMTAIRLWALEKLQRYSAESAVGLRDKLLGLLSDDNRQVRLATAKTLSAMSALNPAEKLLARYKEEADPQVAMAVFDALGEACFFAFSPGSKISLPVEIKTQTIQIADSYTAKEDPELAKKGAEVLRKLLELDGLTGKENQHFLQTILDRYNSETQRKGPIRGELLTTMARLCGQGGQKAEAAKLYAGVFKEALSAKDDNNLVRQAAAMGMVNVDKTAAMQLFRELKLAEDSSPAVRLIMIELSSQTGTADDIGWLFAQLKSNGQSEPAWQAITAILQRQDAKVIVDWADQLELDPSLSGQIGELLGLAEQKAAAQKDELLLCQLQVRLLKWFWSKGQYDQVVIYRDKLMQKNVEKDFVQEALRQTDNYTIEAYLQIRQFNKAAAAAAELLKRNVLSQNSDIIEMISAYFASEKIVLEDKKSLFDALAEIPISLEQNWWQERLEQWRGSMAVSVPPLAVETAK
jgi:HEAT repeat protein